MHNNAKNRVQQNTNIFEEIKYLDFQIFVKKKTQLLKNTFQASVTFL